MNNNNSHDCLQEIQRRHHEPEPSIRTLLLEALLWAIVIVALGYFLGHLA